MEKRKFNDNEKVKYQGRVCVVKNAHFTYFPDGAWWVYDLHSEGFNVSVGEKDVEPISYPQPEEKAVSEAKKGKKRKNKNHGNETKEA